MLQLRDYQRASLDALYAYWGEGGGNGLIVLPTGAGKALVIAALVREVLEQWPDLRIAIVTHSRELVDQNAKELRGYWPAAPIGIYSAGLGRRDMHSRVLFCGIQSVHNKVRKLGAFDLVIVDECFPAGTLISTPNGPRPIETIRPGDLVAHAFGFGPVEAVRTRSAQELVSITFSDGARFDCTANHSVFTDCGWVQAGKLEVGRRVYRAEDLQELRFGVSSLDQAGSGRAGDFGDEAGALGEAELLQHLLLEAERECHGLPGGTRQDARYFARDWPSAQSEGRQWQGNDQDAGCTPEAARAWLASGTRGSNEDASRFRLSDELQTGSRRPGHANWDRDRWGEPQRGEAARGPEERRSARVSRVASVSRLECSGDVPVFNLQVGGHPSYFAEGVLVHNCHLIPRSADTSYGRFLNDLRSLTPDMRVVGLTATPYRLDSGRLDEGEERIFDQVVYDANVGDLIAQGYLSPLMSKATMLTLDVTGVAKRGGDYVAGALEAAVDQEAITREAVAEMVAYGQERKAWLAFCTGVKHAMHVRDEIRSHGITCEMVTGETPTGQREQIIAAFKAGRIRCLTSVSVLTTGFNVPSVDMLALLRPTQSCGLYVQIVGRALRNAPGKANALILDFGGLVRRFGPIDKLVPPKPGKGDGVAPIKECPVCQSICYAAAMVCDDCGHEFPPRETVLHEARADAQHAILSTDGPPWLTVTGMSFVRHRKAGGTDSLRAEFHCGLITHRVWVCLEHTGGARNMARRFWERLGGLNPVPATVEEGLARAEDELVWPNMIQAKQNGKYWEVIGYRFAAGEGWSSRALVDVEEAA